MTTYDKHLSRCADALLRAAPQDRERPFYTWSQYEKRSWRLTDWLRKHANETCTPPSRQALAGGELRDAVARADLTYRQKVAFVGRLGGWSLREIGGHLRMSDQAVFNTLQHARAKVMFALRTSPYFGLGSVYRSEVRRR